MPGPGDSSDLGKRGRFRLRVRLASISRISRPQQGDEVVRLKVSPCAANTAQDHPIHLPEQFIHRGTQNMDLSAIRRASLISIV